MANTRIRICTKNINIRTNPELLDIVSKEASRDGVKASKWIRDCLIVELVKRGYHQYEIVPLIHVNKKKGINVNKPSKIDTLDFLE